VLGLVLAGCAKTGAKGGVAAPVTAKEPELVTLKVAGYTLNMAQLDPVIAAFQDRHENYRVEKVPIELPTTAEQMTARTGQIREMIKNGDLDLVYGDAILQTMVNEGLIADLQPYIQKSGFNVDAFRSLYDDRLLVKGHLYELPYRAAPVAVVYNKDLVSAAGVSIPDDRWTWEQFRETARQLAHGSGQDRFWGIAPVQSEQLVKAMVAGAMLPTPGLSVEEAVAKALEFFGGMVVSDRSMPQIPLQGTDSNLMMAFFNGKAAMGFVDLTSLQQLNGALPFSVAPMPSLPGGKPVWYAIIEGYGIAENSPRKDVAWEFLSFLAGPEGALTLAKAGLLPCYPSDDARRAWLEQTKLPASAAALIDATWTTAPWVLSDKETSGLTWFESRKVLAGTMTPEAAAKEFATRNAQLKAGK
jgi:multiple sugar transport system substrate-binding protein